MFSFIYQITLQSSVQFQAYWPDKNNGQKQFRFAYLFLKFYRQDTDEICVYHNLFLANKDIK